MNKISGALLELESWFLVDRLCSRLFYREISATLVNGMAKSVDPDQTAPLGAI